jgi:hypothetical protein
MFVGDALAMPVHWYYNIAALQRDFGVIRDYQPPKVGKRVANPLPRLSGRGEFGLPAMGQ